MQRFSKIAEDEEIEILLNKVIKASLTYFVENRSNK